MAFVFSTHRWISSSSPLASSPTALAHASVTPLTSISIIHSSSFSCSSRIFLSSVNSRAHLRYPVPLSTSPPIRCNLDDDKTSITQGGTSSSSSRASHESFKDDYIQDPIDFGAPFLAELFVVPAFNGTDVLFPYGEGAFTTVDTETSMFLWGLCKQPTRMVVDLIENDNHDKQQDEKASSSLGPIFVFLRDKTAFDPGEITTLGTLAVVREFRMDKDPNSSSSSSSAQNNLTFFTYSGIVRVQVLEIVKNVGPRQVAKVRVLRDYPIEVPNNIDPSSRDHALFLQNLARNEIELIKKTKEFLKFNQRMSALVDPTGADVLYKEKSKLLDAILSGYNENYYDFTDVSDRIRNRREMLGFFACDQLDLSPNERTKVLEVGDSNQRILYALEQIETTIQHMKEEYKQYEKERKEVVDSNKRQPLP